MNLQTEYIFMRAIVEKQHDTVETMLGVSGTELANTYVEYNNGWAGEPVLMTAIRNDDPQMVELLLKNGANINTCGEDSDTPLEMAARLGSKEMMQILLSYNPDHTLDGGFGTPYITACRGNNDEVAELLKAYNEDCKMMGKPHLDQDEEDKKSKGGSNNKSSSKKVSHTPKLSEIYNSATPPLRKTLKKRVVRKKKIRKAP